MRIKKLLITNLRNISSAELHPGKGINIIQGSNGAGKTTILESIYLLARARAIKSTQHKNIIKHNEHQLTVYSELIAKTDQVIRLGIQKDKNVTLVRKDGTTVKRLTDLARILPISAITPNIQRLLEEGPVHRRKLLNWGLFHVEHAFGDLVTRYNQILKQRNALLGKNSPELSVWTQNLSVSGEAVYEYQTKYLHQWKIEFTELLGYFPNLQGLTMELVKGWKSGLSLQESLDLNKRTDQERHFTSVGPHRMDVKITFQGHDIKDQFSRGQKKVVSILLILAQAQLFEKLTHDMPVLLIDDMNAELDNNTFRTLYSYLSQSGYQVFLTQLGSEIRDHSLDESVSMFHVEHGHLISHGKECR